ncbi:MAG: hypothetical protein LUQ22_01095 [Methanotrichaceae archaeon]|nr:hypothetical protein [Methanotrichaceae archaeon]
MMIRRPIKLPAYLVTRPSERHRQLLEETVAEKRTLSDTLAYVQLLVNRIRYKGLELDPNHVGKIIYLLNTSLSACKTRLDGRNYKNWGKINQT